MPMSTTVSAASVKTFPCRWVCCCPALSIGSRPPKAMPFLAGLSLLLEEEKDSSKLNANGTVKGRARVKQRSFISNRKVLRSERQTRRETRGSRIWSFQREGILMYSVTKQSLPRTTNVWSYFHCVYSGQSLTPAVSLEIGQPFTQGAVGWITRVVTTSKPCDCGQVTYPVSSPCLLSSRLKMEMIRRQDRWADEMR